VKKTDIDVKKTEMSDSFNDVKIVDIDLQKAVLADPVAANKLDAAESEDLLERMRRAHTARVRLNPPGSSREILATFDLASQGQVLDELAAACSGTVVEY
jgi:hypothetical protein